MKDGEPDCNDRRKKKGGGRGACIAASSIRDNDDDDDQSKFMGRGSRERWHVIIEEEEEKALTFLDLLTHLVVFAHMGKHSKTEVASESAGVHAKYQLEQKV